MAGHDGQAAAAPAGEPHKLPFRETAGAPDSSPSAVRRASAEADRDGGRVDRLGQAEGFGRQSEPAESLNPLRPGGTLRPIRPERGPSGSSLTMTEVKAAVGAKKSGPAKPLREPFNPIEENGVFFKDWPRPKLALVITGRQDGYLEPCGCAGLEQMKGGIGRRCAMLEDLRKRGWPVMAVDVGGNVKGFAQQRDLKFQTVAEALKKMGYDAVALGTSELKLPATLVGSQAAGVNGKESIFVSANVALFDFDMPGFTVRKRIVERGGMKVGITAIVGPTYQKLILNNDLVWADADATLDKIVGEMQKEKCDLLVLLAHATMAESVGLAKRHPEFDVVVTSDWASAEAPKVPPQKIGTKAQLIEVGEKGMAAVVLGFYDAPARTVSYQRVVLDSRYTAAPEMQKLMEAYERGLEMAQEKDGLKGLGIRPMSSPYAALLGEYVGSAKCESCHEPSYRVWKKSKHATAYKTLVEAKPRRDFDPECLACHVIGWDPEQFTPYEGGYWNDKKTPELINVGCESCHGPGGAHCAAEMPGAKKDPALQKRLQKAAVVTKEESEKRFCAKCHDGDNSPDFKFETYWPDVEHHEEK